MRYRDNLPLVSANLLRIIYMVGSAVVLQLYLKELGASPFTIALLEVIFWAGMLLFAPLWGAVSDASGRRKLFLALSTGLAAIVLPVYAFTGTVSAVLGTRFLFAVVTVGFPPVALAAMSAAADETRRGRTLAPYHTSRAIGFLIGWGGIGIVLDAAGFQYTFYVLGAIAVASFGVTLFIRGIDTPEPVTLREVWQKARQRWIPSRHDASLTESGLQYLFAGIFLRKVGFIGLFSLIAVYAVDTLGHSASLLGIVLALNPLTQLLFIDLFGTMADRHGRRRVLLAGFLASVPIPFMLIWAANPYVFGAAYALLGFGFAAIAQGSTAFIGDVAPAGRQGELMGFRKSSQGLAGVVGPLLAGSLATVYSFTVMLAVMGVITSLGFLAVWLGADETLDEVEPHVSLRQDVYDTFSFLHR
ncbi:MAG: MFS transporter [Candidatus Nanohaloarchaea archaeon]|nr:MFS transporter [Candidatus Nanohaloarchaea archaeon]